MIIGTIKSIGDARVACTPKSFKDLASIGLECVLEEGAASQAGFEDAAYADHGSVETKSKVLSNADIIVSTKPLSIEDYKVAKKGATLISLFAPYQDDSLSNELTKLGFNVLSLDMIPRSTIAQSMDVLSSMASIAGYKSVLQAAAHLDKYIPMMMTAAGTIKPARVVILGAGVAGLQAIATARRLGAIVEVSDPRTAVKEEVKSLGAKFIEVEGAQDDSGAGGYAVQQSEEYLKRQRELVQQKASDADIVICTAQVRGRKAPLLIPEETVKKMRAGSVIVDLATSTGGNCALSKDQEIIQVHGVTIIGNSNLAESVAKDASLMFANNLVNYLKVFIKDGTLDLNMDNEIIASSLHQIKSE